jgi:peptidoglycan/LPS O-acetylase OafA/YrhL
MVPTSPRDDIAPLTGLRFVAAMLVVLHHYPVPGAGGAAATMMQAGYFGVTLFFVLSGFVLAYTYADAFAGSPRATLGRFAVARFARIYPVYVAILLFAWFRAGFDGPIVSHALLLQAWHPDPRHAFALNGPGWSISVEAFLYACFPVLVLVFHRARVFESGARMGVVLVVVVAAMVAIGVFFDVTGRNVAGADPGSAHRWLYRSPLSRLGDFVLGMIAAAYYARYRREIASRARAWSIVALGAVAAMLGFMAMPSNIDSTYSWDVLYALPGVALIAGLAFAPLAPVARVLGWPFMALLGQSSYCLYLLQAPANELRLAIASFAGGGRVAHATFVAVLVALSVVLHVAFERPVQKALRNAYERRRSGRAKEPSAAS